LIIQLILIIILTTLASTFSAISGFGTSSIMIPLLSAFFPLHPVLLFVGIIHFINCIWKVSIFRKGLCWKLILLFGLPATITSFLGAYTTFHIPETISYKILAAALLMYTTSILLRPKLILPQTNLTAASGGALSGFLAGIIGLGGAIRAVFLHVFNLPKITYIFTTNVIALFIDIVRLTTYISQGSRLGTLFTLGIIFTIPLSFLGVLLAKKIVDFIPQEKFRIIVTIFFALFGLYFLIK